MITLGVRRAGIVPFVLEWTSSGLHGYPSQLAHSP